MQSSSYREKLMSTLDGLREVGKFHIASMMMLLMTGELREWTEALPEGENTEMDLELCLNSDDKNIVLLVDLFYSIDQTYTSIKNINSIDDGID